ncbi:helix-turn-helix domain-containing protein [Sphingopyxis witflariensis]|uniref:XRE family transcriptional regulator n=1 Tax=Sphingopyxis witflariensis TaxID=173675 RepID=A0A246JQX1_9SPHN|nr:helix-turn-helix domain-containing protein [Sphingopyxis witflariensis]OWQ95323.1 XRE family transcriptional regulator [Sphingopyxis witflariensis]
MPIHATIEHQKTSEGQRGAARVRVRIEAQGSLDGGEGAAVVIHNLSATGMLIETTSELTIGQRIMVALPEAPDLAAAVVWRSEALAGCRFDQPLSRAVLSAAQLRNPLPTDVDPAGEADAYEMLPQRLHRLRQERGLSRAALSMRTGLSTPSIWAWETGKTVPRRSNLLALAEAFGISERELVIGDPVAHASDDAVSGDRVEQIRKLVDASREQIATLAGVMPANVKIAIEL